MVVRAAWELPAHSPAGLPSGAQMHHAHFCRAFARAVTYARTLLSTSFINVNSHEGGDGDAGDS
jgi:hypothetical protein